MRVNSLMPTHAQDRARNGRQANPGIQGDVLKGKQDKRSDKDDCCLDIRN